MLLKGLMFAPDGPSGGATPPSTPSPEPTNEGVATDDFSGMLESSFEDSSAEGAEGTGAAPVAPEPAPVQEPEAPPQPEPVPQEPPAQGQQRTQEAPQPSSPVAVGPDNIPQLMLENRDALVLELSNQYQLSQGDIEALTLDTPGALAQLVPKAFARVHFNAVQAAHAAIQKLVPQIVENVTRQMTVRSEVDQQFVKMWPELKPEHAPTVRAVATAYRSSNPNATRDQAMKEIGKIAYAVLGIPLPQPGAEAGAARSANVSGAAAPRVLAAEPFVPARGGVASPPSDPNPWAGLALDYDE